MAWSASLAFADPADTPAAATARSDVGSGSHTRHVEHVRKTNLGEYERIIGLYDRYLAEHPGEVVTAVEKCLFVSTFALAEDDSFIESATDELERCREVLASPPYGAHPAAQLYLLQSKWGDEGIAAGEALVPISKAWPREQRADLHARLAFLYSASDDERKAGTHAIQAVELDAASRALIMAALRLEQLGAKTRARAFILAAPSTVWGQLSVQQAGELLLRVAAPRDAVQFLRARDSARDADVDQLLLARALVRDGQVAAAREMFDAAIESADTHDYQTLREHFTFERRHGSQANAEAAYARLRDSGYFADPMARFRMDLFISRPLASWSLRDATGILTFVCVIGFFGLLPLFVIAPVHYRGLARRLRGWAPAATQLPWGLKHAWYALGLFLVAQAMGAYWLAYPNLENMFGWAPFNSALADDRALGRAYLVGVVTVVALGFPVVRGVPWLSLFEGVWPLRRSLSTATACLFAFRLASSLWATVPNRFGAAALGSDTTRALQGMHAEFGMIGVLLIAAVAVPILEEIVFRGVLLNGLARHVSFRVAAVVQALAFAAMHEDWSAMPLLFLFGLTTAWLYRRSQGLVAPIAFHVFNNGLSVYAVVAATLVLDQAS